MTGRHAYGDALAHDVLQARWYCCLRCLNCQRCTRCWNAEPLAIFSFCAQAWGVRKGVTADLGVKCAGAVTLSRRSRLLTMTSVAPSRLAEVVLLGSRAPLAACPSYAVRRGGAVPAQKEEVPAWWEKSVRQPGSERTVKASQKQE